jgi:hypothetical protein
MHSNFFDYLIIAAVAAVSVVTAIRAIKQGKTGPQYGLKWTRTTTDEERN